MTHSQLMLVLIDAVKSFPVVLGMPCKRLNTFCFLEEESKILDPNFGADSRDNGKTFFSRDWSDQGRVASDIFITDPSMTVILQMISPNGPGNGVFERRTTPGHAIFKYVFQVTDIVKDQVEDSVTHPCEERTESEILEDCTDMMLGVFNYLADVVCAEVPVLGTLWKNKKLLDHMVTEGQIPSYEVKQRETKQFRSGLESLNSQPEAIIFKEGNRLGIDLILDFQMDYCKDWTFNHEAADLDNTDDPALKSAFGNESVKPL